MKKRAPIDCKTFDQICGLGRDNLTVDKDYWIMTGEEISINEQCIGSKPTQSIDIPISVFNKMVRWYIRPQSIRKRNYK